MPTQHIYRLLIGIRAADQAAYNSWWRAQIDTSPGGELTFSAGLSATGNLPATHYVMCGSFTAAQLKKIVTRLCTLAGIAVPVAFDTYTRAQKRDWLRSQIPTLKAGANLKALVVDDNDGTWDDYAVRIAEAGVKPVQAALP